MKVWRRFRLYAAAAALIILLAAMALIHPLAAAWIACGILAACVIICAGYVLELSWALPLMHVGLAALFVMLFGSMAIVVSGDVPERIVGAILFIALLYATRALLRKVPGLSIFTAITLVAALLAGMLGFSGFFVRYAVRSALNSCNTAYDFKVTPHDAALQRFDVTSESIRTCRKMTVSGMGPATVYASHPRRWTTQARGKSPVLAEVVLLPPSAVDKISGNGGRLIASVHLADLPSGAFWQAHDTQAQPAHSIYGNEESVRWQNDDSFIAFTYIRNPRYHARPVLTPLLDVSDLSTAIFVIIGAILVFLLKEVVLALFKDAVLDRVKRWMERHGGSSPSEA